MYLFDGTVCRNRLTISSIMIVHPVTTVRDEVLHKEDDTNQKKEKKGRNSLGFLLLVLCKAILVRM